jgi:hypothetical protein
MRPFCSAALHGLRAWGLPLRHLRSLAPRAAPLRPLGTAAALAPPAPPAAPAAAAAPPPDLPGTTQADADGFYVLMFTCTKCDTRTARRISKHGYHHGSVLVRCPGCLGLHLIADHLGFFSDEAVDAEGLIAARSGSSGAGVGGSGGADASVYELSADDARVLASAGKSVRLTDGAHLHVVDFKGAAPQVGGGSRAGGAAGAAAAASAATASATETAAEAADAASSPGHARA